ncbi:MAG: deoxyribonuclease IV [Nitrospinaceae bacterium]
MNIPPRIGAHVSISGGLYKSIENAEAIRAETFQIFGASARTWEPKFPAPAAVDQFKTALKKSGIGPVFLHAPYLINLASADPVLWEKSVHNLTLHLNITRLLGVDGLVVHVGSGKGMPRDSAISKVVLGIKKVFRNVPGTTRLVIENAAGVNKIGSRPEDWSAILKRVKSKRLKICFDTAHAFEAGWIETYQPDPIKAFFDRLDEEVGTEHLVLVHANDSKTPFNSHHDRHENIGMGYIGLPGFKNLAREKRVNRVPWILEVPGFDGEGPDKKNIECLRACFQ